MKRQTPRPYQPDLADTVVIRRLPQGGYHLSSPGGERLMSGPVIEAARSELQQILEFVENMWGPLDEELNPKPEPLLSLDHLGKPIKFPIKASDDQTVAIEAWSDHGLIRTPMMQSGYNGKFDGG